DPFAIGNALREIRKNAQEALADSCEQPKLIRVTATCVQAFGTSKQYVEVEIRDNGPGIKDDIKPRLFQPYFTTKAGGTGLGLSIVKKIISAHGGTVDASNSIDGGA